MKEMINFEKRKDEILEKWEYTSPMAVTHRGELRKCSDTNCSDCIFSKIKGHCNANFIKWLYEEYKKPIVLDDFTKELLKRLYDAGWRYIAKDSSGEIYAHKRKTIKRNGQWQYGCDSDETWILIHPDIAEFDFLSWNDEEPTAIEELIKCK